MSTTPETPPKLNVGGTPGGGDYFLIGILMMCIGFYLLLSNIAITNGFAGFGMGMGLYSFGGYNLTSGMILLPICFGLGWLFFNGKSIGGWILFAGGLAALIAGVIANIHFSMRPMSLFNLLCILTLTVGGLGFFFRSLRAK